MDLNYQEIADRAAAHALKSGIVLDYSEKSIAEVESILGEYYNHLAEYDGREGADTLWNIAVHYGIYLGETMLRLQLGEKGFAWYMDNGMPVLKNRTSAQISPITKAHKRMLNGPEDNVKASSMWQSCSQMVNSPPNTLSTAPSMSSFPRVRS